MSDDKTEEPTRKKLEKAREEGNVAKSQDLIDVACLAAVLGVIYVAGRAADGAMHTVVRTALGFASGDRSIPAMIASLRQMGWLCVVLLVPVAGVGVIAAVAALAAQVGFKVSFEPVMPKFESINPASGFKRIFSMKSLVDLAKMTVTGTILAIVMWKTIEWLLPLSVASMYQGLPQLSQVMKTVLTRLMLVAIGVYLVFGALDYKVQRWLFIRQQRMSKDEVKREYKDSEGDARLKQERRRLGREWATTGVKKNVARANMLVVNPTHYAVAVRYVPDETPLPVVVAKGVDEEAALLRRYAFEAGVPIVANPPVARALHKVEHNEPIPEALFEVVAAILRWVDGVGARRDATLT